MESSATPSVDLLLSAGYLLTMEADMPIIEDGAVAIAGDCFVDLGSREELVQRYPDAKHLAEPHGLLMPGLINAHTHVSMSCFRGLADDLPLMDWLQNYIFPAETRLTGEIVYQSTLLTLCEMIRSGTTTFNDMYLFTADIARAVNQVGMRAYLGEGFFDFPSPCYGEIDKGFAYVEALLAEYEKHPLIDIAITPHTVYTCSPDLLQRAAALAEKHGRKLHIHLSETEIEVSQCEENYGCSPVEHLENLGVLGENVIAAHGVVLSPADMDLLARRGVAVVHCPESNMKLSSGIAHIPELLSAGVTVALGTDGAASNNDVDMFGEMDFAAKVHKIAPLDPTRMPASTALHTATLGGAQALGREKDLGSIAVGKKADCIVLNMRQPHLTPLYNPVSQLVYAARGGDVMHSVINGQIVMENKQLLTIAEEEVLDRMQETAVVFRAGLR